MDRLFTLLARLTAAAGVFGMLVVGVVTFSAPGLNGTTGAVAVDARANTKYFVTVDAGSSGSRVFVYKWSCGHGLVLLPGSVLKVEPGLSSYADHPEGALKSLVPLMELAASKIPSAAHSTARLTVLATAGLRMVPEAKSRAILATLAAGLRKRFGFHVGDGDVRIITGVEEGMFSWLAVNHLLGRLGGGSSSATAKGAGVTGTVGMLDMGGGSAQMAFELPASAKGFDAAAHGGEVVELPASMSQPQPQPQSAWAPRRLYVATLLGFGANKARDRYIRKLERRYKRLRVPIKDPCLQVGQRDEIERSAAVASSRKDKLVLEGTGDYDSCLKAVDPLLHEKDQNCGDAVRGQPCTTDTTAGFPKGMQVLGFSEFWYSMQDVYRLGGAYSQSAFDAKSRAFCGRPWKALMKEYDAGEYPGADHHRFSHQCFKAAWMAKMLHVGYKIPPERPFASASKINGEPAQWTLGVVIKALGAQTCAPQQQDAGGPGKPAPGALIEDTVAHYLIVFSAVMMVFVIGVAAMFYRGSSARATPATVAERRRSLARARSVSRGSESLLPR